MFLFVRITADKSSMQLLSLIPKTGFLQCSLVILLNLPAKTAPFEINLECLLMHCQPKNLQKIFSTESFRSSLPFSLGFLSFVFITLLNVFVTSTAVGIIKQFPIQKYYIYQSHLKGVGIVYFYNLRPIILGKPNLQVPSTSFTPIPGTG